MQLYVIKFVSDLGYVLYTSRLTTLMESKRTNLKIVYYCVQRFTLSNKFVEFSFVNMLMSYNTELIVAL
jgi:hypothetical protein